MKLFVPDPLESDEKNCRRYVDLLKKRHLDAINKKDPMADFFKSLIAVIQPVYDKRTFCPTLVYMDPVKAVLRTVIIRGNWFARLYATNPYEEEVMILVAQCFPGRETWSAWRR